MNHRENLRLAMALFGCALWLASSFMPLFGGGAKVKALCRGRAFDNTPPCYVDYLPLLEMLAPLAALGLLYPFARFALSVFAPEPRHRQLKWRLASTRGKSFWFPAFSVFAAAGVIWAGSRASTYPIDSVTAPYMIFWLTFALWFLAATFVSWLDGREPYSGDRAC